MSALTKNVFDSPESVDELIRTLHAASAAGDQVRSNAAALALRGAMLSADEPARIAITHAFAKVALGRDDVDAAASELSRCSHHSDPTVRACHLEAAAEIAGRRYKFDDQAALLVEALEILKGMPAVDVAFAARLLHSLTVTIRETSLSEADSAIRIFRALSWTSDLADVQSTCAVQLAWIRALAGDLTDALRFAQKAVAIAPTLSSRLVALVERATLLAVAREACSAQLDAEDALALVDEVDLSAASEDVRLALAGLAKLTVTIDAPRARGLLAYSERLRLGGGQRVSGIAHQAAGAVARATGDDRLAYTSFLAAYASFERGGCEPRAAQTALAIHGITGEEKWLQAAQRCIRSYPLSWIADAIRTTGSGVADPTFCKLTPRQREVFYALLEGLTAGRIAVRIGAAPNTVRNHIHAVYAAFRVTSQAELLADAWKRKLT